MVIVRLTGGIGNQMFQYAAARRVSWVNNTPLFLDLGWFQESGWWTRRKYELDAFRIAGETPPPAAVRALKSRRQNPLFRRLPLFLKRAIFHTRQTHIIEKSYNFDPDILNLREDVYLDGYWQSEKYFSDIESVIRYEFSFRANPAEPNRRILDHIASCESVSIHIRRGDYVTLPEANAFHGLCPAAYYQSAVDQISRQVGKPVFFVFSDDIVWARENLDLGFETRFMDQNDPERGDEDLRLMSACRHHIIANSSFSWWGAWLCNNPQKIVYAPRRWFDKDIDTPDNLPTSWIRL
jgi:hypothetical protein